MKVSTSIAEPVPVIDPDKTDGIDKFDVHFLLLMLPIADPVEADGQRNFSSLLRLKGCF